MFTSRHFLSLQCHKITSNNHAKLIKIVIFSPRLCFSCIHGGSPKSVLINAASFHIHDYCALDDKMSSSERSVLKPDASLTRSVIFFPLFITKSPFRAFLSLPQSCPSEQTASLDQPDAMSSVLSCTQKSGASIHESALLLGILAPLISGYL